jgi:ribosomal protein S6--L-glutamate ligase
MDSLVVIHYEGVRAENWTLLEKAAQERALQLISWAPHLVEIRYSDSDLRVYFDGNHATPAALMHRTISPFRGIMVPALTCLASQGTLVPNNPEAAFRTRDKLLTDLMLRAAGIPVVPTVAFDEPSKAALATLGRVDLIVKPAHGVRGEGIETAPPGSAPSIADKLRDARLERLTGTGFYVEREHYLAQVLINGGGSDLRAYVIGSSCVALMRRTAPPGEVRANIALGAKADPLSPSHPAGDIARAALAACGLDFGGVDMVEDADGTIRVIEVDAWAGFAGITQSTGVDVASAILDYIALLQGRDGES